MAQEYDKFEDSYYSPYQTDDKKYECRTGPFEGFFVGSVEFCKFNKFDKDDRKDITDNQTGTQGHLVHKLHQEQRERQVLLAHTDVLYYSTKCYKFIFSKQLCLF